MFGSNSGFFIACLKRYSWDITGIDTSECSSNRKLGNASIRYFPYSTDPLVISSFSRYRILCDFTPFKDFPQIRLGFI